jgi:hypothetical protein
MKTGSVMIGGTGSKYSLGGGKVLICFSRMIRLFIKKCFSIFFGKEYL